MEQPFTAELKQSTRFLFADFDGLTVQLHETDCRGAYLDGRVGVTYGRPMDEFQTLISLGNGIYVRYAYPAEGPGGFDVFDFSDSATAKKRIQTETDLSGIDAFDYVWHVYDAHTFGTLKIRLGEADYFRDVTLAWCKYSLQPDGLTLLEEAPLEGRIQTFLGADSIGFAVFSAQGRLYYVTRQMPCAAVLP